MVSLWLALHLVTHPTGLIFRNTGSETLVATTGVHRYHDLRLTAVEARAHFLANFLEVCRLNHHGCPWSLRRVTNESRVGELTEGLHPDYQASGLVPLSVSLSVSPSVGLFFFREVVSLLCSLGWLLCARRYFWPSVSTRR